MTKVTIKQEKFLQNLIYKGMSQREAYRDAYNCEKMKDKSVDECACRLLKNIKVSTRAEEMREEKEGIEIFNLTKAQEKFVEALVLGESQRKAYKQAFNCKNFKDKTVDEKASRLFHTDKIQARYKQLLKRVIDSSEKDTIMQSTEMQQRMTEIARSNLGQVIKVSMKEDGSAEIGLKEGFDITNVQEIYIDKHGQLRVKMHNQVNAMMKLSELQKRAAEAEQGESDNEIKISLKEMEGLGE